LAARAIIPDVIVREGGRSSNPQPLGFEQKRLSPGNTRIKIVPIGIEFLNHSYFPISIPPLQPLLSLDRIFYIIKLLEVDESMNFVLLRKTLNELQPVLADATGKIIGHSNIERAPNPARKNVNVEAAHTHHSPLEYWIVRLRGR
jgi:hypothetical protein